MDLIDNAGKYTLRELLRNIRTSSMKVAERERTSQILVTKLKEQATKCKQEIDTLTLEYIRICEDTARVNGELMHDYIVSLHNRYDSLVEHVGKNKQVPQRGTPVSTNDIECDIAETINATPTLKSVEFVTGDSTTERLKDAFGSLVITVDNADDPVDTEKDLKQKSANEGISSSNRKLPIAMNLKPTNHESVYQGIGVMPNTRTASSAESSMDQHIFTKPASILPGCPRTPHNQEASSTEHISSTSTIAEPPSTDLTHTNDQTSSVHKNCASPSSKRLLENPIILTRFRPERKISAICPTNDGYAWVVDNESNILAIINNKGETRKTIKHHTTVETICLEPTTGHLWFTGLDEEAIYAVSPLSTSPVEKFCSDDMVWSLCITRNGEVVVGTYGQITLYTPHGQMLHRTTKQNSGIVCPWSISHCPINYSIAVVNSTPTSPRVDELGSYINDIIVFDQTLRINFRYKGDDIQGHDDVAADKFLPCRLAYDSLGNLVVADCGRNTVYLLSGSGVFIRTLHTSCGHLQGLLALQANDVLWTMCLAPKTKRGTVQLLRYYTE